MPIDSRYQVALIFWGQLSYAALDALWPEPLPLTSLLWLHPKVTVMPHVARRPIVAQIVTEIAVISEASRPAGGFRKKSTSQRDTGPHLCIANRRGPCIRRCV